MTDGRSDGGPAFPVECSMHPDGRLVGTQTSPVSGWETGMSLRDYFAGQALAGLLTHAMRTPAEASREAYQLADAMLAAREDRP